MLIFPQLTTGAAALYPLTKRRLRRTALNTVADGHAVVFGDPDAAIAAWELRAVGLMPADWNAIEDLFQQTSGMARTFTFLDPVGNLLLKSEDFNAGAWSRGALIQFTAGIADPLGTTRATGLLNTGQAAGGVAQTLDIPGDFQYCLSVWARSTSNSTVALSIANVTKTFVVGSQWRRVFASANPGQSSATTVTFTAQVDVGGSAELFGMQAEAQLGPSDYKVTGLRGGVYSKARFGSDQITVTAQSAEIYDAVISIVSAES